MRVLIVESNPALSSVWSDHLDRLGLQVMRTPDQDQAMAMLAETHFSVVVVNTDEMDGKIGISDYCSYRWPSTRVLLVTNSSFFSDGLVFGVSPNTCAVIPQSTPPSDLAAMVCHYAGH